MTTKRQIEHDVVQRMAYYVQANNNELTINTKLCKQIAKDTGHDLTSVKTILLNNLYIFG